MAATDQTYRNQKTLDIVFAASSVALLLSMIWMFVQDYNREWKTEQREFRDVEAAMFTRQAIADLPPAKKYKDAKEAVEKAKQGRDEKVKIKIRSEEKEVTRTEGIKELDGEIDRLKPEKERAEAKVGDIKSLVSSRNSFYDIAKDHGATREAEAYKKEVEDLEKQLADAQAGLDQVMAEMKEYQRERDKLDRPLSRALTELKLATDELVRRARTAVKSQWGIGDWFRSLPILDAFASPTKIHQFTLNDLTIDYNFKGVTRFDRCMTCHRGIDRPAYTREALRALRESPPETLTTKLNETRDVLKELRAAFAGTPDEASIPRPNQLDADNLSVPASKLTDERINEFAAHPRLDLFVGSNSKHPAEKFGCTICHSGQGSATDFFWATHTPNSPQQAREWKKTHDWGPVHFWDFPMHPRRFIESSCLKCHHQVTDLITSYNRHEAPRLLRGYNLIRENGCFGCHEIQGTKDGNPIGPDLRLEPYPAPDLLPPADRVRLFADKDNPPGNMRKVGPSLFRLSEKTNEEWAAKWIKSPRSFRPDTKMPHFYGLSNNNAAALAGTGQEKFPDAEVASIAHFLFTESDRYLKNVITVLANKKALEEEGKSPREHYEKIIRDLTAKVADKAEFTKLDNAKQDEIKAALEQAKVDIFSLEAAPKIHDPKNPTAAPKDLEEARYQGRKLFSERGCLACHNHHGTTEPLTVDPKKGDSLPAIHSEAHFGPTLSQVKAKLGTKPGKEGEASARTWLIHWITNPSLHSPRTRMPVTHLDKDEAAAVAEWLLSQPATELGADWKDLKVAQPEQQALEDLAKVYLVRIVSRREMGEFFKPGAFAKGGALADRIQELPLDEKSLANRLKEARSEKERREQTMWYVGRKAVGRLGCFGCHDIPGFENAKPVGTGLNEWGKKDAGRLAFEDIMNYMNSHHTRVDDWKDVAKVGEAFKEGAAEHKTPYEGFFWDALAHSTRVGYLHQKIKEPRSYDYGRLKPWDDRSRMPQFRFANPRKRGPEGEEEYAARKAWQKATGRDAGKCRPAETDAEFRARAAQEEAEARQAVMTFVLGLTGEAIPAPYRNQPGADRLAELKGRQVLDKYNCAGCHNVRPGAFEFRVTKDTLKQLSDWKKLSEGASFQTDYDFTDHYIWGGRPPASPDVLVAHGVGARLRVVKKAPVLTLTLTEALAYRDDKGRLQNIRGANTLGIPAADLIFPSQDEVATPEALREALGEQGPLGGRFADLLVKYLMDWGELQKQSGKQNLYPDENGDNGRARASVPPPLFNQGERTQSDWLFRFLRDPPRVRKLTVLRMPRFNLSDDEARALASYFAAADRLNNPDIGLTYPHDTIPQRGELTDRYWTERTADYVRRLEADPKRKLYDAVLAELTPAWEEIVKERKAKAGEAETKRKEAEKRVEDLKAAEKNEKDAQKKKALADSLRDAEQRKGFWAAESQRLRGIADKATVDSLRQQWRNTEAYAHAGYRVLTKVCASCHEVGQVQPSPDQLQGPSLNLSHERLRPGWLKRWIAHPQRYLPYASSMPQNFPNTPDQPQFQELIAGTPLQQVLGVRDALINFPVVSELPVNRAWLLSGGTGEKK
jgi:mono/diheme cytochrome c family protein